MWASLGESAIGVTWGFGLRVGSFWWRGPPAPRVVDYSNCLKRLDESDLIDPDEKIPGS